MTHGCLGIHENLLVGDNFEVTYLGMRGVNDIPFSILLTRGCYVSVEEVGDWYLLGSLDKNEVIFFLCGLGGGDVAAARGLVDGRV